MFNVFYRSKTLKACLFQNDDIINFVPIQNNPLINEVSSELGIDLRQIASRPYQSVDDEEEPVRTEKTELSRWLMLKTDSVQMEQGRYSKEKRKWTKDELSPIQQAENLLRLVRRDLEKIQKLKNSISSDVPPLTAGPGPSRPAELTCLEKWAAIELVNTQHQIHQGTVWKRDWH